MSICCRERNSFRRYMDTYVMLLGNKKCGATCEKTLLDFSLLFWDTPPPPPTGLPPSRTRQRNTQGKRNIGGATNKTATGHFVRIWTRNNGEKGNAPSKTISRTKR